LVYFRLFLLSRSSEDCSIENITGRSVCHKDIKHTDTGSIIFWSKIGGESTSRSVERKCFAKCDAKSAIKAAGSAVLKCFDCEKVFKTNKQLKSHVATHSQERPFICDVCNKTFKCMSKVREHKRNIHQKEKDHICDI
jgi:uncharacterized Zn-finger protein